ncbi:hypothetical protein GMI70_02780 [Eggerthellaceae bacterium zg-893]|nr:hypothetical protein [Eggerthellaceae bacterium zg-893]
MGKYVIEYFEAMDEGNGGFGSEFEAETPQQAVVGWIRDYAASYDEGTKGREDFDRIKRVEASDEGVNVSAYRISETEWELHTYADGSDEFETFTA